MAEEAKHQERSLLERWLEDQRSWQRTVLSYMDSLVKSDDFLVHLGNAMRGSLLAGKAYPGTAPDPAADGSAGDERFEQVLFALHRLEGQLQDLKMGLDELAWRGDVEQGREPTKSAERSVPRRKKRAGSAKKIAGKKSATKKSTKKTTKKNKRSKMAATGKSRSPRRKAGE